ncbi:hypothetical protein ACIQHY_25840 [Streptomyces sp. NPDC092359]|uniref:hypothetical protein n=1 Tax=Streptomyces sp. NPDC092359 TaxID=3366014 RepID=UPI003809034F
MTDTTRVTLSEEIARAVLEVPGVAFLRPRLSGLLRPSAGASGTDGASPGTSAGISVREAEGGGSWDVGVRLVALSNDRTLEVARAARRAVEDRLESLLPGGAARAHVTVTVTGRV